MYLNHGTYMRHGNSEHSDISNSDKDHINMDTQQDNARVNNSNMLRVVDSAGTNKVNIHKLSMIMVQKQSRSGTGIQVGLILVIYGIGSSSVPQTLKEPFPKGVCTYAHSTI